MHLIILPGNAKEYNEQWLQDTKKHFEDLFESTHTHVFRHWQDTENYPEIDLDHEASELEKTFSKLDGEVVLYAKSAGTVVTINAIANKLITPTKCIFVGAPFNWAQENYPKFNNWIKNYDVNTLFIQQTNDMFLPFAALEKFLKDTNLTYTLKEVPGKNHGYISYEKLKNHVEKFTKTPTLNVAP